MPFMSGLDRVEERIVKLKKNKELLRLKTFQQKLPKEKSKEKKD